MSLRYDANGNLIDGVSLINLSKLLKKYFQQTQHINQVSSTFVYGNNVSSTFVGTIPVDVSLNKQRMIQVQNSYNVGITVNVIFHEDPINSNTNIGNVVTSDAIAAGAAKIYYADTFTQMDAPFPGISVSVAVGATAPTSGSITIWFFGGPSK